MSTHTPDDAAQALADALHGRTVSVAESLTGGQVCAALAAVEGAGTWFMGGVVAYATETKQRLLDFPGDNPYTAACAEHLAVTVRRQTSSDLSVGVTGVGGPGAESGQPPGSVWVATAAADGVRCSRLTLAGDPTEVVRQAVVASLVALVDRAGEG